MPRYGSGVAQFYAEGGEMATYSPSREPDMTSPATEPTNANFSAEDYDDDDDDDDDVKAVPVMWGDYYKSDNNEGLIYGISYTDGDEIFDMEWFATAKERDEAIAEYNEEYGAENDDDDYEHDCMNCGEGIENENDALKMGYELLCYSCQHEYTDDELEEAIKSYESENMSLRESKSMFGKDKNGKMYARRRNGRIITHNAESAKLGEATLKRLRKTYDNYEDRNEHMSNYMLLATFFGTDADKEEVKKIMARRDKRGYLTQKESTWLYENINPYYDHLRNVKAAESPPKNSCSNCGDCKKDLVWCCEKYWCNDDCRKRKFEDYLEMVDYKGDVERARREYGDESCWEHHTDYGNCNRMENMEKFLHHNPLFQQNYSTYLFGAETFGAECITCASDMSNQPLWGCECCGMLVGTKGEHEGCGFNEDGEVMCNLCYSGQCDCKSFGAESKSMFGKG
jgi:hypothetical protein